MQVRQHAEDLFAGALHQPVEAGFEQGDVAAEAVDQEAGGARALAVAEQLQGADELGKDPAAVDIADDDDGAIDRLGEAHVGDVAVAQVDLGRAPGALDQHHVERRGQTGVGRQRRVAGDGLVIVIPVRIQISRRAAVDDDLGVALAGGLEQDRVHIDHRLQTGRACLLRLGPADLAAVGRHRAVQRHVLRLERRHPDPPPRQ